MRHENRGLQALRIFLCDLDLSGGGHVRSLQGSGGEGKRYVRGAPQVRVDCRHKIAQQSFPRLPGLHRMMGRLTIEISIRRTHS